MRSQFRFFHVMITQPSKTLVEHRCSLAKKRVIEVNLVNKDMAPSGTSAGPRSSKIFFISSGKGGTATLFKTSILALLRTVGVHRQRSGFKKG